MLYWVDIINKITLVIRSNYMNFRHITQMELCESKRYLVLLPYIHDNTHLSNMCTYILDNSIKAPSNLSGWLFHFPSFLSSCIGDIRRLTSMRDLYILITKHIFSGKINLKFNKILYIYKYNIIYEYHNIISKIPWHKRI